MKLTLKITEDHIKLIKWFNFKRINDKYYGIDTYDVFDAGDTFLFEQMANILGYQDKIIPETRESYLGPLYEKEYQDKLEEYDRFIIENFVFIEEIIHQFCDQGGLNPGIYSCLDNNRIWKYNKFKDE